MDEQYWCAKINCHAGPFVKPPVRCPQCGKDKFTTKKPFPNKPEGFGKSKHDME